MVILFMNNSDQYRKIACELSDTVHDENLWFACLTKAKGNYETASALHDKYVVENSIDHNLQSRNYVISYKKLKNLSWAAKRIAKLIGCFVLIVILIILIVVSVNY